ncbi:MAG: SDR family NAD(P)-dependent oxidoreductase [Nakamurella sp.]
MTFSDPVGWPRNAARAAHSPEHAPAPDSDSGLPPLPTLAPLPRLKPLAPMPLPTWDDDIAAVPTGLTAPPPPANHPAADSPPYVPTYQATQATDLTAGNAPDFMTSDGTDYAEPYPTDHSAESAPDYSADYSADHSVQPVITDSYYPAESGTHAAGNEVAFGPRFESDVASPSGSTSSSLATGRHSSIRTTRHDELLPYAPGLKVLVIGGTEPLSGMVAERLISSGHRLAIHGVTIPAELPVMSASAEAFRAFEPISLVGDRADTEEMVHTVARAEVALGGLDALVMLPAQRSSHIGLDADASTWADEWSLALTTEVLAAACATHIAARSFLARRKAGRIVLVTNGRDGTQGGAMPASATRAALSRLGADLTRELGPHGIGVSVVATGPGGTQDFAVAQVADVVDALLSTPVLSGVSARIG